MNQERPDGYDSRVLRSLRRVIRAVDKYSHKLNTELGLTTPQLLCLDTLARAGEPLTQKALGEAVTLGASTVNGIVDRLEAKQYLLRRRSGRDRRQVFLELTPAGRGVLETAPSPLQNRLSTSFAALSEERRRTITEALELVVRLMEADTIDASPNLFAHDKVEPE